MAFKMGGGAAQAELPCNWFCCWYAGVELDSSLPSRTLQDLPNTHEHLPVWGSTADDEEDKVLDVGDTCKCDCDLFMTILRCRWSLDGSPSGSILAII
jgi:hypothetical protein